MPRGPIATSIPSRIRAMLKGQRIRFRYKSSNTVYVAVHRMNKEFGKARLYISRTNGSSYMDVWRLE